MNDDQRHFLTLLAQPPARFTAEQAAWALNCQPHDLPVLIAARLLKPLGNPLANGAKYFSAADVRELAQDRAWLARMTNAIYEHWRHGNRRRAPRSRQPIARLATA
jgi:hypothetical protein